MLKHKTGIVIALVTLGTSVVLVTGCSGSGANVPPVSGTFAESFSGDGIVFTIPSLDNGKTGETTLKRIADTGKFVTYEISIEDSENGVVSIGDQSDEEGYIIVGDLTFDDVKATQLTSTQHAVVTCSTTSFNEEEGEEESENEEQTEWNVTVTVDGRDGSTSIADLPITNISFEDSSADEGIRKALSIAGVDMTMSATEIQEKLGAPISESYPEADEESFATDVLTFPIAGGGTVEITYSDGTIERMDATSDISLIEGKESLSNVDPSIREALLNAPTKTWMDATHSDKLNMTLKGTPVILNVTTVGSIVQAIPGDWKKEAEYEDTEESAFHYLLESENIDLTVAGDTQESTIMGVKCPVGGNNIFVVAGIDPNLAEKDLPNVLGKPISMESDDQGRTYIFNFIIGEDEYPVELTFGNDGKMTDLLIRTYAFIGYDDEIEYEDEFEDEEPEGETFYEDNLEYELALNDELSDEKQ